MKSSIKHIATLLLLMPSLGQQLFAQGDATLIGSRVDPIRIAQNPAYISEEKVVLGLGISRLSTRVQAPLSIVDILTKTSEGKTKLYLDEALTRLGGKAGSVETNYNLFLLGLRTRPGFFTLGVNLNTQTTGGLDKQLTDLLATGNGLHRGSWINTKGIIADAQSHIEVALGYATDKILSSRKLNVGARAKLLFGQQNVRSLDGKLNLRTSVDGHDLEIEAYQRVMLRMPYVRYTYDDLGLIDKVDIKMGDSPTVSFSNPGFGIDLGASYKIDERWTLGVSLRNLGFIKWQGGHILTLDQMGEQAIRYKGIDISSALVANKDESDKQTTELEELGKEIKRHLKIEEQATYTTSLPLKLHAMADFQALDWLSLSALAGLSQIGNNIRPDLALAINCMPSRGFGAHLSISSLHGSPINLGAGLVLGRKVQLHIAIDNLLMLNIDNAKYAHLTAGLNFRF